MASISLRIGTFLVIGVHSAGFKRNNTDQADIPAFEFQSSDFLSRLIPELFGD
jgi:hypothetical protein